MPTNDFRVKMFYKASDGARDIIRLSNNWISRIGMNYVPRINDIVINWGRTTLPFQKTRCTAVINTPEAIYKAVHKDLSFNLWRTYESPWIIPNTNSPLIASGWINSGMKVIGRRTLTGTQGHGIEIYRTLEDFNNARTPCLLYTQYIQPRAEYRIHVVNNEVIDVAIKRKRTERVEADDVNPMIRNLDGGWVYVRSNVVAPPNIITAAIQAVSQLGLNFGAVDIIQEKNTDKAYVLEVNTAPGMSDGLAEKYVGAFHKMVDIISKTILRQITIRR